jgi:hypothetical protein
MMRNERVLRSAALEENNEIPDGIVGRLGVLPSAIMAGACDADKEKFC